MKAVADSLLAAHHQDPVGMNWASTFVKCRLELKVKLNQKHNYKQVKCKDLEIERGWFQLVKNTKAKHDITNKDSYNFDKAGFMMGVTSIGAVVTGLERLN